MTVLLDRPRPAPALSPEAQARAARRQAIADFKNGMMPIAFSERAIVPEAPRAVPLDLVVKRIPRFLANFNQRAPALVAEWGGITWNDLLAVLLDCPRVAFTAAEAYERCRAIARSEGLPIEGFN